MMNNVKQVGTIIEFNTNRVRGVFVKVPDGIFNCAIIRADLDKLWLVYPDKTGDTRIPLPEGNWKMLGKSHSVSKENVDELGISFEKYMKLLYDKNITYDYDKYTGQWLILIENLFSR